MLTPGSNPRKTVTVAIPCRNEGRYLRQCLESLVQTAYDTALLDVHIALAPSSDQSAEIAEEFARRHSFIKVVDNPCGSKSAALNRAISDSSSEVFIRLDAHSWYPPEYLPKLVRGLETHRADNIGGIRHTAKGVTFAQKLLGLLVSHPFAAGNARYRTGSTSVREVDTVYGGCLPMRIFSAAGLFNEQLVRAQDREFNYRLRAAGGKVLLDPDIYCVYFPRDTLRDYLSWIYQGSYWLFSAPRFTNTRLLAWRNFVPLFFALYLIALLIACTAGGAVPAVWLPLIAYLALDFFFSLELAVTPGFAKANRSGSEAASIRIRTVVLHDLFARQACNVTSPEGVAVAKRSPLLGAAAFCLFPLTHLVYGLGSLHGWISCRFGRRK